MKLRHSALTSAAFCLTLSACATISPSSHNAMSATSPQNIILFVGDGMGVSTVTAARIFDGQSLGLSGEDHSLAFEDFGHLALIKTYNANAQVPDSAGTATAIMSGYKANIGTINVSPNSRREGCAGVSAAPTLSERAMAAGKAVGIISTARITHATPAAMYGHVDARGWEADKDLPDDAKGAGCQSLAAQLVDSNVDLVLGGGSAEFTDDQISALKSSHYFASNPAQLLAAPEQGSIRGLFTRSHMSFEADRVEGEEPSLAQMTQFAIDRLSGDAQGYVLLIEAGRVDHAHHGTNAYRALTDMQALNEAVKVAKAKVGDDTLILVTADHSHVFTMAGYPARGNPILGLVKEADSENGGVEHDYALAGDGKPYTTLGYQNGVNIRKSYGAALTDAAVQDKDYRQEAGIHMESETHGGEDVPLYASGPGAHKVAGVMDQDEIGRMIVELLGLK